MTMTRAMNTTMMKIVKKNLKHLFPAIKRVISSDSVEINNEKGTIKPPGVVDESGTNLFLFKIQQIQNVILTNYFILDNSFVTQYFSYLNLTAGPDRSPGKETHPIAKAEQQTNDKMKKESIIVIVVVLIIFSFLMALVIRLCCKRKSSACYQVQKHADDRHNDDIC